MGIRDFGPAPVGSSTRRGENSHRIFKTAVVKANNRKSIVKYPALMHERKAAFFSNRFSILNPLRSWKKKGSRIRIKRNKTSKRTKDLWKTFGQGDFEELATLTILNTNFHKTTFYFKSDTECVRIDNLLIAKEDSSKLGFFGQVFSVTIDPHTRVPKIDQKTPNKRFNVVLLEEFKSTFYEQDHTSSYHYLRRPLYTGYDYEKNPLNEWVALIPWFCLFHDFLVWSFRSMPTLFPKK